MGGFAAGLVTRVRALLDRIRRRPRIVRVVDQAMLAPGACVHVLDVEGTRLVVATTRRSIRLLARLEPHGCAACGAGAPRRLVKSIIQADNT